jgi:hypothetical protein
MYDVGHGDHILLEFPEGQIGIIDSCFGEKDDSPPALAHLAAARAHLGSDARLAVQFLCISHPHVDHIKGFAKLVHDPSLDFKELWFPVPFESQWVIQHWRERAIPVFGDGTWVADWMGEELRAVFDYMAQATHTKKPELVPLVSGRHLPRIGPVEIESVGPSNIAVTAYNKILDQESSDLPRLGKRLKATRGYANRISAMLLFRYGANRILFTGDAGRPNLREFVSDARRRGSEDSDLLCHVVKAPHHGSKYSVVPEVWNQFAPSGGTICVSALGVSSPHRVFYDNCHGRNMYCTNFGPCIHRADNDDDDELDAVPCCGDIRVSVGSEEGDILVETQFAGAPCLGAIPFPFVPGTE